MLKKHATFSTYQKLFTSTFSLSAFTFGGGYVMIPLMKKKFVDELGWIEEREMLDLTAIAQSSPGAIAINASILLGYRIAGISGALICILGTVLPPLIILSIVSLFYNAFRSNPIVASILRGMQSGVAAVICDVVLNMGADVVKSRNAISIFIMLTAFIATYFLRINVMIIILACALIGLLQGFFRKAGKA